MNYSENSPLIERALKYARSNFENSEISVEDVAMHAGFSTNYFNQIFAAHTGFSVMEYIRFKRLREAARLLWTTDMDILDVALEVGYASHEGFLRCFKQQYGCTPSEYREKNKGILYSWKDMADPTVAKRFLKNHPDFKPLDEQTLIDELLEKDPHRYGYLCVTLNGMAQKAATDLDDPSKGFVLIGDSFVSEKPYKVTLVSDDADVITRWLHSLEYVDAIYTNAACAVPDTAVVKKEYMYLKTPVPVKLPGGISVRELTPGDQSQIRQWAGSRNNGLIQHLLQLERSVNDDRVLEYGFFADNRLLAVASCAPEKVHGFALNDCINILFAEGKEQPKLYRTIYKWITNEVAAKGWIPFDNIQQGTYAASHGGFTSEDIGYSLVQQIFCVNTP